MQEIKISFAIDGNISLSDLSKIFDALNYFSNSTFRLDAAFKKKLLQCNEFSENELPMIIEKLKTREKINRRDIPEVEIHKLSMNSPLEMIVYSDIFIHIAILLLGGKRTGLFNYEIPVGLLQQITRLYGRLRK